MLRPVVEDDEDARARGNSMGCCGCCGDGARGGGGGPPRLHSSTVVSWGGKDSREEMADRTPSLSAHGSGLEGVVVVVAVALVVVVAMGMGGPAKAGVTTWRCCTTEGEKEAAAVALLLAAPPLGNNRFEGVGYRL